MVREKYGEIAQNPPHFPGRHFTGVQPFNFRFKNFVSDVNFLIRDFRIAKTCETSRIINNLTVTFTLGPISLCRDSQYLRN